MQSTETKKAFTENKIVARDGVMYFVPLLLIRKDYHYRARPSQSNIKCQKLFSSVTSFLYEVYFKGI